MTETTKIKIGFALALLGVLFTLNPIVNESNIELDLFTAVISIKTFYWIFAVLLGVSVYCYGITLIGERKIFDRIKIVGNILYSITLLFPFIILFLFLISLLSFWIYDIIQSEKFKLFSQSVLSVGLGVLASIITSSITRYLSKKDKTERIEKISEKSSKVVGLIRKLVDDGFYELATLEVWKMIELTLDKVFISNNINLTNKSPYFKLNQAKSKGLISEDDFKKINEIREYRNIAVHKQNSGEITRELIDSMIKSMDKILSILENQISENCYSCNKNYLKQNMHYSDFLGIYVCKDCANKNPDWENEYIDMGMDT
jgi:hypothetical protein